MSSIGHPLATGSAKTEIKAASPRDASNAHFLARSAASRRSSSSRICASATRMKKSRSSSRRPASRAARTSWSSVLPFSDPTADGPVIARASERSIAGGGGLSMTLARGRQATCIIHRYSARAVRLLQSALRARRRTSGPSAKPRPSGIDALLVVDLPYAHGEDLLIPAACECDLARHSARRPDEHAAAREVARRQARGRRLRLLRVGRGSDWAARRCSTRRGCGKSGARANGERACPS